MQFGLFFYFFLLANGGAIVGALLGFIDKSWQIGKNRQIKLVRIGRILCSLLGFSFPLWLLILNVMNPSSFIGFFESFVSLFYINIPELILFIDGITSIIGLELELRKQNVSRDLL